MTVHGLFKATLSFVLDTCEIYLPQVTFSLMFFVFLIEIVSRYLLNSPVTWTYEITAISFVWTTLLGACFALRTKSHVVFAVVYDALSERGQRLLRLVGKTIIVATFGIAVYPSYDYIRFVEFQKSTVFRIPFSLIYAPFLVFLVLVIGRTISEIVAEIAEIRNRDN